MQIGLLKNMACELCWTMQVLNGPDPFWGFRTMRVLNGPDPFFAGSERCGR